MKEKASARTKYATRIMLDLGLNARDGKPRKFDEIARSQRISAKFVSTIAVELKRAGLISSHRGAYGGISLAKNPKDLPLLDVIEAVRGRLAVMPCLEDGVKCPEQSSCPVYDMWQEINERIRGILSEYSLADVMTKLEAKMPQKARARGSKKA